MDIEQLEKQLDTWKQWLLVAAGASATFFITTLVNHPRTDIFSGWYVVLLAFWLSMTPAGFILLMGRKWRTVPLTKRLNIAFGFLGCAWLVLLTIGIIGIFIGETSCISFLVLFTIILGAIYFYLRKRNKASEQMFP